MRGGRMKEQDKQRKYIRRRFCEKVLEADDARNFWEKHWGFIIAVMFVLWVFVVAVAAWGMI
jgi:hypothetical protein